MLCLSPCAPPHLHGRRLLMPHAKTARRATVCLGTPEERRAALLRWPKFQDSSAAPAPSRTTVERRGSLQEMRRVWWVCGVGYWVQGFRCFPWLALNFHLARGLGLSPAALQLAQNAGNLPLVAKPLFGVLSDAVYVGRAHRLPYITIGGMPAATPSSSFCLSFLFFSLISVLAWPILLGVMRNLSVRV
jgi:hypothetical protein